ncbi:unnamed protein product [Pleuronectes platessa]|uniref:Uncharacterized protein n=1 Tax=Pleuronectes platessa TaxID=8262 RepID=A0A9N7Z128_PLEPL|nr:unnamed protein product [Pleuronectes platessa]
MEPIQPSVSPQKQKNKSQVPECGNETPAGQISILGKQNSPLGRLPQTRWVYPEDLPHRGTWLQEKKMKKKRLGPQGKMEEEVTEVRGRPGHHHQPIKHHIPLTPRHLSVFHTMEVKRGRGGTRKRRKRRNEEEEEEELQPGPAGRSH